MSGLDTALSMLNLRPPDERDANYDDDCAEIRGMKKDTEEELSRLREAESEGKYLRRLR